MKKYLMVLFYNLEVPYGTILQRVSTRARAGTILNQKVRYGNISQSESSFRYYLRKYAGTRRCKRSRSGLTGNFGMVLLYNLEVLSGTI